MNMFSNKVIASEHVDIYGVIHKFLIFFFNIIVLCT